MKNSSVLDPKVIQQFDELQMDGLPDILIETIDSFLSSSPERYEQILKCVDAGDAAGASKQAHGLKSSSRTLGATLLGDVCQEIESLQSLDDSSRVRSLVETLKSSYRDSCEALRQTRQEQEQKNSQRSAA